MIESNVIECLDFDDTLQKIEPYSKKYVELYFRLFRSLCKNKPFPIIIDIILIIISFIQLLSISIEFISLDNDIILGILNYLNNFLLLSDLISTGSTLFKLYIIIIIIILLNIIIMIILIFTIQIIKIKLLFYIVNILNAIIYYYLIGPAIEICLIIFCCGNEKQKYFNIQCISELSYLKYSILSIIMCLLFIFISILYSIYNNEIGTTTKNINEKAIHIQCKYEIFNLITKIIIFIFYFCLKNRENSFIIILIYESVIFILCAFMSFYVYRNVYYYYNIINYIIYFGWYICSWFSACIIMKLLLKIKNITAFIIIGWLIFLYFLNKNIKINEFLLLTETKNFEFKNIKSMENFFNNLLKLLFDKDNIRSRILLNGIVKKFEEYSNNNIEINYYYQKLINDKYLINQFGKNDELPILSIIYILYHLQMEKANNKDEIILYMCYFLINHFNNPTYAIFLCSKVKSESHLNLYFKYLLAEDIKEYLTNKLNSLADNDSVEHIQIGSPILYYLFMDLFKIKIYDAICKQIDYFDIFKEQYMTYKLIENILKIGNKILKIRREIIGIWEKIIDLNPFNEESYKDYMLYLDTILKDEMFYKEESKRFILLKHAKLKEQFNIYNSMFLAGKSSILLVDGYISNGKILYATPNFDLILSYNDKEIINSNIEDLLPNIIQSFHKEVFDEAIKYSNINNIFKSQKNFLLKNKNGRLINVKLFIKPVPNLCYGLIYFVYIHKRNDSNFIILLDKDLRMSGFSEIKGYETSYTIGNGFNLNPGLFGYHIGVIIPSIFSLLYYKNGEFNIIKKDLKIRGFLYPISNLYKIKLKVDFILDKIKNNKKDSDIQSEDVLQNITYEYKDLIKELSKERIKPYSILYNIKMQSFLEEKYKYYKIYIYYDIITEKYNFREIVDTYSRRTKTYSRKTKTIKFENTNNVSLESQKKIEKKIINKSIIIIEKSEQNKKAENNNTNSSYEKTNNINHNINKLDKIDKNKEFDKKCTTNIFKSPFSSITSKIDIKFNRIKLDIINQKETFPGKLMLYLCIIFGIVTIFFLFLNEKLIENSFQKLSTFLDENIFFNMTKMGVAVLYITSINIKWQLHSCSFNTFYNITELNKQMLIENIEYLKWIRNFTNNLGKEFDEVVRKKYIISLGIYGTNKIEKYNLNNDNLLAYFVNSGINLLKRYPSILEYFINKDINQNELIEIKSEISELNNLAAQAYFYFNSDINGFREEEKNKKTNKIYFNFPVGFICSGLILLILLIIYIFYTLQMYKIEIYFTLKIINFNYINLDLYIKQLHEIKKKLRNDNEEEEEEEKEEINININESNLKGNSIKEETKTEKTINEIKNINKKEKNNIKRYKNKQAKIKLYNSYFFNKNLFFGIKLIIIIIIYLSYFILSILIEKSKKKEFVDFDSINDSIIGVFKESYDIFISFKRQLELHENTLTNCEIDNNKDIYKIKIPLINNITTPNLGNAIMKITTGLGHKSESLTNLTEIFSGDACRFLTNTQNDYSICSNYFWNGILLKGIEQTIVKMGDVIKTIIEELDSINTGGRTFKDIIQSSTYSLYELFIEFYYQKAYILIDEFFWAIRNGKLYYILKIIKTVFISYIIISISLFLILIYFVFSLKNLFNSFLNFIAILPQKYLSEDEIFYNEIIRVSTDYF